MVDLVTLITLVPTEKLVPNPLNPNSQNDETFNGLVEAIEEEGFVEPVQAVERADGLFDIVGGEHRWRAMTVLGEEFTPCVLLDPDKFDADRQAWNLVKMNVLHGDLNPVKFSRLFDELKHRYDEETLKTLMGFTTEDAFARMYQDVRSSLPPELQDALDDAKDEIKTIDDLSGVLNRLFAEFGATLPSNMMVFSFGGKEVLWVRCDNDLWATVKEIAREVADEKEDMSAVLNARLSS